MRARGDGLGYSTHTRKLESDRQIGKQLLLISLFMNKRQVT
jgi:hypothetical protein